MEDDDEASRRTYPSFERPAQRGTGGLPDVCQAVRRQEVAKKSLEKKENNPQEGLQKAKFPWLYTRLVHG